MANEKYEGTRIYGASDDLIEFDGEYQGEVGHYNDNEDEPVLVFISDGTLLEVVYGKADLAVWRVTPVVQGSLFDKVEVCNDEDAKIYSDVVYMKPGIKWAYVAKEWEKVN